MPVEIFQYTPKRYVEFPHLPKVPTSWNGLERILPDLIERSGIKNDLAIEFGVWHGYSTAALAENFKVVIGVDIFEGDLLPGTSAPMIETSRQTLALWPNITLVKSRFQDYLRRCPVVPDFIHIDILHTYEDTFACGCLSLAICDLVIFHDTESFPEVKRACSDLAQVFGLKFRNYYECFGLGILTTREMQ